MTSSQPHKPEVSQEEKIAEEGNSLAAQFEGVSANDQFDKESDIAENILWIMKDLDLDVHSEHFQDTPLRVAKMLMEFRQPRDLYAILKNGFESDNDVDSGKQPMVIQNNIPLRGLCAHHLLPWHGTAAIAYLPRKRIVGLSKLTRLTQAAGTVSPSTQEEVTATIAEVLHKGIEAEGVIVITRAIHTCMAVRGVNAPNVWTTVSSVRGMFLHNPTARSEALMLIGNNI